MPLAAIEIAPAVGAGALTLFGVLLGMLVQGSRAERERRRELFARAFAACVAYYELPYAIRRRQEAQEVEERIALVHLARRVGGECIAEAWAAPGAATDAEMNVRDLDFSKLKDPETEYLAEVHRDLSWWRVWR